MNKQQYGQFYTTNVDYILSNIKIPKTKDENIIEPFVGGGDIIKWMVKQNVNVSNITIHDIEPNKTLSTIIKNINMDNIKRDTLNNPPDYKNKVIVTNPPYLARNKAGVKNKDIFAKYKKMSDLFRIHICQIVDGDCSGGIQIIPLNFLSSIKKQDVALRDKFLSKYKIIQLNIFEEQVFDDTSYTICSFNFERVEKTIETQTINTTFYPSKENQTITLDKENMWLVGGEIYKKKENYKYKITRLTSTKKENYIPLNIKLYAIDSGKEDGKIRVEYDEEHFVGKVSSRTYATFIVQSKGCNKEITQEVQKNIVKEFNDYLNEMRLKYRSLFLANYRESKNGKCRKRISFDLAYTLLNNILMKY